MVPAQEQGQLIERAREGDAEALDELLRAYQGKIWRFSAGMCSNPQDAQDVTQETLLAAARNIRDFRGEGAFSTWLLTMARRFCGRLGGRSKFAPRRGDMISAQEETGVTLIDQGPGPEQHAQDRELAAAVQDGIASLDPMYREVVLLRDVEGLTASEVAEVLGVGVDAVKSRLHRGRVALRSFLAPALGAEPAPVAQVGCPDVLLRFSQHLEQDIGPEVCAQMEAHLHTCPRCQGACDSLRQVLALCKTAPPAGVPEPVQHSIAVALRQFLATQPSQKTRAKKV